MLQRQQTLWLILSVVADLLSFKFPFATGKGLVKGLIADVSLNGGNHILLLLLTGACLIVAGITLFMYKDRKLQLKLCLAGMILSILLLIGYFVQFGKIQRPTLALSCIFPFAVLAGFIMAFRGIRHDEKLVKSLDKLR
jgi:hypothetical protein